MQNLSWSFILNHSPVSSQESTFQLGNLPCLLGLLQSVTLSKNQVDNLLDEIEDHLKGLSQLLPPFIITQQQIC